MSSTKTDPKTINVSDYVKVPRLYMRKQPKAPLLPRILMTIRLLIHFFFVAVCCAFAGNIGQAIGWVVSYFNPKRGLQIISFASQYALVCFVWSLEFVVGLELEFSGDVIPPQENAVVIGNHISDVDFVLFMSIAHRKGMLGNVKYMAKNSLRYIPFVGWGMSLMGMIFLKREWEKDKASIEQTFQHLTKNKVPVWALAFLEGTRITERKHQESIAFHVDRGVKFFDQTLIPRTKGFIAMVKHFRNSHVQYLYDVTFAYVDGVQTVKDALMKKNNGKILINIKRHKLADLPESEEGLVKWCYDCFDRKDHMLSYLATNNKRSFDKEPIRAEEKPCVGMECWVGPFEKMEQEKKQQ